MNPNAPNPTLDEFLLAVPEQRRLFDNLGVDSCHAQSFAMTPRTPSVTHNVKLQRFESQAADAPLAFLSYIHDGEHVILDHTFVPDELRGRGVAAVLVRAALDEARQQRWKIVPRCWYVAGFIERNPEFADLVDRKEQDLA